MTSKSLSAKGTILAVFSACVIERVTGKFFVNEKFSDRQKIGNEYVKMRERDVLEHEISVPN